jgi:hypothetical protein
MLAPDRYSAPEYNFSMEPAERVAHALVKVAFIVFALIISLVFDEFGHEIVGLVVCVVGIVPGMLALTLWKNPMKTDRGQPRVSNPVPFL